MFYDQVTNDPIEIFLDIWGNKRSISHKYIISAICVYVSQQHMKKQVKSRGETTKISIFQTYAELLALSPTTIQFWLELVAIASKHCTPLTHRRDMCKKLKVNPGNEANNDITTSSDNDW